ncbi:MAG: hypothetical protein MK212_17915 [Saprospiraceae bacterium]|nr:hypothetical protein [Saprospiraceae bacterium]
MTEPKSKYIELNVIHPYKQASAAFAAALLFMFVGKFIIKEPAFAWQASTAMLLFFTVFNAATGIFVNSFKKYLQGSMIGFVSLILGTGLVSTLVSGVSIKDPSHSYRTIYIVLILGFFTLLAMSFLIRGVVDFLSAKDKQDKQRQQQRNNRRR